MLQRYSDILRVKFTELFFCVSTPYKFSGILGRVFSRVNGVIYFYRIILLRVNPIQVFGYIRESIFACQRSNIFYRIILLRVNPIQVFGYIRGVFFACQVYRIILLRVNPIQVFGYIREVFFACQVYRIILLRVNPIQVFGYIRGIFSGISRP